MGIGIFHLLRIFSLFFETFDIITHKNVSLRLKLCLLPWEMLDQEPVTIEATNVLSHVKLTVKVLV